MSVQVLTLFDLEPIPQPPAPEKKERAVKKETEKENNEDAAAASEAKPKVAKGRKPRVLKEPEEGTPVVEKNYYSIGETANMFKVRTSHIRFWTVQFALKMRTTRKGDRLYTPENIEQLKVIHHLVKEQGFTIAGAKTKLKELKKVNLKDLQKSDVMSTLKNLKATLLSLRNQI